MDRNSIIGLLLIFAILIGYAYLNQPSPDELLRQQEYNDSIAQVEAQRNIEREMQLSPIDTFETVQQEPDRQQVIETFGDVAKQFFGEEETYLLSNGNLEVTFTNKGARIQSARLPEYLKADSTDLILFDKDNSNDHFVFFTKNATFKTDQAFWELEKIDKAGRSISFKLAFDDKAYILSTYKIDKPETFGIDHQLTFVNMDRHIQANNDISYVRTLDVPLLEWVKATESEKSTIYYCYDDEKPDYISETKFKEEILKTKTKWVSFKQHFFNTTVISKEGFLKDSKIETLEPKNEDNLKYYKAELYLPFDSKNLEEYNFRYYMGPNHFQTLRKEGEQLEAVIPLGWSLFRWVNRYLVIPTFNFLNDYTSNYGLIILLLTIFIKILLFPLVYKSYISTAKMRLLKPELDEIREKFKDEMAKIQTETMKLYKKAGVSPVGGCLPMLLQFPILIAMFAFFPSSFELRQQPFLWAVDLSRYDSILELGFEIPFYGSHVSLFTLLMTISTIIYTRMNNQLTGANSQMKVIAYVMPVMFLGFFNNYPAALSYYYFLANVITFMQQAIIKRFVDEDKLRKQIAENKSKKINIKKSSFQKRLEEYAKKKGVDPNAGKKRK
jgi:YidC/Oxa1 family membrane protein insertase